MTSKTYYEVSTGLVKTSTKEIETKFQKASRIIKQKYPNEPKQFIGESVIIIDKALTANEVTDLKNDIDAELAK